MIKDKLIEFADEAQELARKHNAEYKLNIDETSVDITVKMVVAKYERGDRINDSVKVKDIVRPKKRPGRPPKSKVTPIDINKERD